MLHANANILICWCNYESKERSMITQISGCHIHTLTTTVHMDFLSIPFRDATILLRNPCENKVNQSVPKQESGQHTYMIMRISSCLRRISTQYTSKELHSFNFMPFITIKAPHSCT